MQCHNTICHRIAVPFAVAVISLSTGSLSAQELADGPDDGAPAEHAGEHADAPKFSVTLAAEMNMSADAVGKPISVAPDVWVHLSHSLLVGIVHSYHAKSGFYGVAPGQGSSLCTTGEDNGCPRLYDSTGLEARYHLPAAGSVALEAEGGLYAHSLDPFTLGLKVGVRGRWESGALAIEVAPGIFAGLNEREATATSAGNKEIVHVPVDILFEATPKLTLGVQSGIEGHVEHFADHFTIPVYLAGRLAASPTISGGLAFGFPNLAGKHHTADARALILEVVAKL